MTEEVPGQGTLPADFPEPVMTADILINRSIEEGLSQLQYFTHELMQKTTCADESPEARNLRLAKANMHCFSYLLDAVLADVLQEVQGYSRTWADSLAADLDYKLEGGDYYPEMIWEWATERGLDPEAITEKAKAKLNQKDSK